MNGGTIPSNRTQYVTFFNTTGVIERHKNMYYVPRFSQNNIGVNQTVANTYYDLFQRVCPPSSVYTGIQVSSWSPEDRTLVVQGNIDDFRCITDEGECLNYVVVTRTVTKGQNTQVIYYAFFISDAKQSGGSSITLTLIPDDFTNVFYLHNNHLLTQLDLNNDYEPFNEHMKNCYVKRQHYNRVTNIIDLRGIAFTLVEDKLNNDDTYTLSVNGETREVKLLEWSSSRVIVQGDSLQNSLTLQNFTIKNTNNETVISGLLSASSSQYYGYDNMNVFKNTEEVFKYKYQYKDKKDLADKKGNILDKLRFLVIELKGNELLGEYHVNYINEQGGFIRDVTRKFNAGGIVKAGLQRINPLVIVPFIDDDEGNTYHFQYLYDYDPDLAPAVIDMGDISSAVSSRTINKLYYKLNQKSLADYVLSVYVVKSINLPYSRFYVNGNTIGMFVDLPEIDDSTDDGLIMPIEDKKLYPLVLNETPSTTNNLIVNIKFIENVGYVFDSASVVPMSLPPYLTQGLPCFMISGYDMESRSTWLKLNLTDNLKDEYFDPTLELEPYSFYSLSSLNYEMPIKMSRLIKNGLYTKFDYDLYVTIDGSIKSSVVPYYRENKKYPYYNESLTFTYLHTLPLVSDSYSSYYYQNMSQMKNQYAVLDNNFRYDMLQHFFVSGPNAVGMRAGKMGWVGALLETGNQVMQMVDEGIDYYQNKDNIELNQKAKLADMGRRPDVVKQSGSEVYYDILTKEDALYLNHYTIDKLSYNSIAKLLERTGYKVDLYDTLHVVDRVGWNFVQLNGFDYEAEITVSQEDTIRKIFSEGVTLLHDKSYLTSGHNYETILDE